ncbi:glycoside hydrolase family 108 protein [Azospirillum himalayense]|uniref:Glycoside hydrolase family 108 protein n=1 Tax=Azospirillum himalayense TaxID=654847 RepID=A0ABW0G6N3_9PROT
MPSTFDMALAFVLTREGGYTNDPRDPGGETSFGISKAAYPGIDIKGLTRDGAAAIYRRDYWDRAGCGNLPAGVALFHFDTAVNQGPGTAAKFLQLAAGVEADGKIGPKTLAAVQRAKPTDLLTEYAARRADHYARLPHFPTYGLGWMRRLCACLVLAIAT